MPEVVTTNNRQLSNIIRSINKYETLVDRTILNNQLVLLKKRKPFRLNVYLK